MPYLLRFCAGGEGLGVCAEQRSPDGLGWFVGLLTVFWLEMVFAGVLFRT